MKITVEDKDVYKFEADSDELTWIGVARNFEEAKQMFLGTVERRVEEEIQMMFIEFHKNLNSK
jgi:hypothetical protein